ncbi:MAG: IS66 family transposase [Chloroflexi bacterium]|nr:IS66 family transposase [Chloroflexota bacterium]
MAELVSGKKVACSYKEACPHLNFEPAARVLAQRDYLSHRVDEMARIMDLAREKIETLQQENEDSRKEKESLKQELREANLKVFKPNLKKEENKKKRGSSFGHRGNSRRVPGRIDHYVDIYPARCHRCGGKKITLYEKSFEEHVVEDIQVKTVTTCYRSHYGYCPECKKVVYPVRDGLSQSGEASAEIAPRSRIGPNARAIFGYLRYIGVPFRKVVKLSQDVFGLAITHPALFRFETEMAKNGEPLYQKIKEVVRHSPFIHADETGWRVDGKNFWLWEFINKQVALFRIEDSRGSAVVKDTLGEKYEGVLHSDFYSAYNDNIKAEGKQKCLAHLLREAKKIEEKNSGPNGQEELFCQKLKGAIKGAIESWNEFHRGKKTIEELKITKEVTKEKLLEVLFVPTENKDIRRLKKRIIKHQNELLTFLDQPEIEPTNNRAERGLRASVIMRKITFGSRSVHGARNHQVLMSILQTAHLQGTQPLHTLLYLVTNRGDSLISFQEKPDKIRPP